jgi:5-(aminomethyl)-3-furanmethanol phosphate kinase
MGGRKAPVVVKLGGSFAFSTHLRGWLQALATCAGRAVIVPGGGPFADAVRAAQPRMGFDDCAAHHMALLAMEQYGRALIGLNDALSPAATADAIRCGLAAKRVPVWMPTHMALSATDLAPTWETTADSLAAWLAGKIDAERLIVVKHGEFPSGGVRLHELAAAGIVDDAFARHVGENGIETSFFGPSDHGSAMTAIRDGVVAGVPVI